MSAEIQSEFLSSLPHVVITEGKESDLNACIDANESEYSNFSFSETSYHETVI